MSGFVDFTQYQAEAFVICLLASVVWAGALLLGARGVERWGAMSSAERLWIGALLLAVLPSLAAPTLAAFGLSLRAAPEPVAAAFGAAATAFAPQVDVAAAPRIEPFDIDKIIGAAAILYIYGALLAFFLWAARNVGLYYAVSRATPVDDGRLLDQIADWADRLGVRAPSIRRSRHVSSVCIIGVVRQTILIPDGINQRVTRADLVLMCAHELAHVKRGDTRLFTATQLARILFWFNPLVARIASNAELAAEERADALILALGVDRRTYAAVFVEGLKFAAFRKNAQTSLVHALAPSFTPPDRRGRRRRLTAILSADAPQKAPLATRLMLSAAGAAVALVAVGQAALAVDPESAAARRASLGDLAIIGDVRDLVAPDDRVAALPASEVAAPPAVAPVDPVDAVDPVEPAPLIEATDAVPPTAPTAPADVIDPPDAAALATDANALDFAGNADATARMMADAERRLLGAAEGDAGGAFNLTMRHDDKVYRFSSDEPMTAEKRAELRAAIADMRAAQEDAKRDGLERRRDMEQQAEAFARHAERLHDALAISRQERAEMREAFQMSRRDFLEIQHQAIVEACADLDGDATQHFDEASADLDDAERDLSDFDLSPEALRVARAQIDAARVALESDRRTHERAIRESRRSLEAQQKAIEREIELLDVQTAMLQ